MSTTARADNHGFALTAQQDAGAPLVLRLMGGLGNQLFQYATGRALAQHLGAPLLLDARYVRRRAAHSGLALTAFQIQARVANAHELRPYPEWAWRLTRALRWRWRPLGGMFHERGVSYDRAIWQLRAGSLLSGFWQSERYFTHLAEVLRSELVLTTPWPPEAQALYESITAADLGDAVALHVRRGDYASAPDALRRHGLCSPSYYNRAIEWVRQRQPGARFHVFSDDVAWAAQHLALPPGTVWVSRPALKPQHDLLLMAACKHHIISNSTFGWWGAWLNPGTERIVIAPTPWFDEPGLDGPDRWPVAWQLLHKTSGEPA